MLWLGAGYSPLVLLNIIALCAESGLMCHGQQLLAVGLAIASDSAGLLQSSLAGYCLVRRFSRLRGFRAPSVRAIWSAPGEMGTSNPRPML